MGQVDVSIVPASPTIIVYDPGDNLGNGIVQGANANESLVMRRPTLIEVQNMSAGTTVDVRVTTNPQLGFKSFALLDGADDGEFLVEFLQPYNFVKLVRVGATDPTAASQFGNVGHGSV